jgi:hypothetical protein
VTLSNIPDLTAAVGVSRVVGIEYPFGRLLGAAGDAAGQRAVLAETLNTAATMTVPGTVHHLPYVWPEPPGETDAHPAESPPIVGYLLRRPWLWKHLINREVPA